MNQSLVLPNSSAPTCPSHLIYLFFQLSFLLIAENSVSQSVVDVLCTT